MSIMYESLISSKGRHSRTYSEIYFAVYNGSASNDSAASVALFGRVSRSGTSYLCDRVFALRLVLGVGECFFATPSEQTRLLPSPSMIPM